MPCHHFPITFQEQQNLNHQQFRREVDKLRKLEEQIDKLTNMLCTVCKRVDEVKPAILQSELMDVGNWYYQHRRFDEDEKRREREQREQQLLYKKRQMEELQKEIEELSK